MTWAIPDSVAVCPVWCQECDIDRDGTSYHRGQTVTLMPGVEVHVGASQRPGEASPAPVFQLVSSMDDERTREELEQLVDALRDYLQRA